MKKYTVIRDTNYDYIKVSPIEKIIIDSSLFQRLRYVSQNAFAFYTYPSNVTSRFSHSLGAMHLSGKMFLKALENSEESHLRFFLENAKRLLEETLKEGFGESTNLNSLEKIWESDLGNISGLNHYPLQGERANLSTTDFCIVNIFWQSVRLSALLHDIGHYPYSHLFEQAVKIYGDRFPQTDDDAIEKYKHHINDGFKKMLDTLKITIENINEIELHEKNSAIIIPHLKEIDLLKGTRPIEVLANICNRIAHKIYLVNRKGVNPVLVFLHSIVSSEIDCDRLDYCVRDPRASGLELGAIDVDRIVNSMVLFKEDGELKLVLNNSAVSSIEEFFHQRFLLYKYLVYHHNVVRMDGVMKEILVILFEVIQNPSSNKELFTILVDNYFCNEKSELFQEHFTLYDDGWLKSLVSTINLFIKKKSEKKEALSPIEKKFLLFSETILFRKSNNLISLWKSEIESKKFIERLSKETGLGNSEIISYLNNEFETVTFDTVIENLKKELDKQGIHLINHTCSAKIYNSSKNPTFILYKNFPYPLQYASDYIKSLDAVKESTIEPKFAFIREDLKGSEESSTKIYDGLSEITYQIILNYIESIKLIKLNPPKAYA